jgi:peroxiredoxin
MRSLPAVLLATAALPLLAQATYQPVPSGEKACPRIESRDEDTLKASSSLSTTTLGRTSSSAAGRSMPLTANTTAAATSAGGAQIVGRSEFAFILKAERQGVEKFTVLDAGGKPRSIADLKGKVVVVGFWQTACEPSTNLMIEMAELQAKGEKFGFEVWPVNYDPERWVKVRPFIDKNRKFFEKTQVFLPDLGAKGPGNFAEVFPALPALFIVDREGKVAVRSYLYEPNALLANLKKVLVEK